MDQLLEFKLGLHKTEIRQLLLVLPNYRVPFASVLLDFRT